MEVSNTVLVLSISCLLAFWIWLRNKRNFWKQLGVETPPYSLILGHLRSPFFHGGSVAERVQRIYQYVKSRSLKYVGLYVLFEPWFVVIDLDLIKSIMQSDFQHFTDRAAKEVEGEPLTAHLLSLKGERWKQMRRTLTPAFTSGKMKMMFETLMDCTHGLKKVMDKELESPEVDIKDILGRFTTDIIGTCAFGIECNSLENPDNEFREKGRKAFQVPNKASSSIFRLFLDKSPKLIKFLNIKLVPQDINDFFMSVVKNTIEYREKNNVSRKDLLQLLIDMKNKKDDKAELNMGDSKERENFSISEDDIVAQMFVFFEAGFETSSTTMTFCLYELSKNKSIQNKLRNEIRHVLTKYGDKLTYDAMMNMPYLDKVISETLRKYPPGTVLLRTCTKRYKLPGTEIILNEGVKVFIPIYGIHWDPDIYEDPEKFDPERFSDENKKLRHDFSFLAFGEGPRMCIGMRFGLMQAKVGLITLLQNYEFDVSKKTKEPLEWDPKFLLLSNLGDIWLKHKRI
ncbi:hypothetical protein WA026_005668 [Henosepilachna vigintioctopunctata]|uniref:Cytochrome P450 n=1 Tax=Henosepilachna vigintioctopunctata TaxID=420089 RepID=A0AAW1U2K0_9CUCU